MSGAWRRVMCTLQLMYYALFPAAGGAAVPPEAGEVRLCAPRQVQGGMDRLLNDRGELRLFFADCLAPAAPFILFRLKREGFSRCSVQASERGLYVEGRR